MGKKHNTEIVPIEKQAALALQDMNGDKKNIFFSLHHCNINNGNNMLVSEGGAAEALADSRAALSEARIALAESRQQLAEMQAEMLDFVASVKEEWKAMNNELLALRVIVAEYAAQSSTGHITPDHRRS